MLRQVLAKCSVLSGIFPWTISDHDEVPRDSKTVQAYQDQYSNETARQRLQLMFSIDEFGRVSPEVHSVTQASIMGFFVGAIVGGTIDSRRAYLNFIEGNQATSFDNHFDAKKKLQDKVTIGFGKGAFKWGWRLSLFTGSYVLFTTAISVYRGKSGVLEYIAAGAITGACYKVNLGLRGIIVGGALGSVLGLFGGATSVGLMKLAGTSPEEMRFWQYRWKQAKMSELNRLYRQSHKDEDPIMSVHEEKVGKGGLLETITEENVQQKQQ